MALQQDFNTESIGTAAQLAAAVAAGHFKAVRHALECGIRPDACDENGDTALLMAVRHANLPIAGMLLGYGAGVQDDKLLAAALVHKSDDMVDLLLESGADPLEHKRQSKRLLTRAVVRGVDKAVTNMLMQGADHLLTDDKGASLLILAAENGHAKVVDLLLKAGLDVHKFDNKARSALRAAMQNGNLDCVNLLLAAGADPGVRMEDNKIQITDYQFSRKCAPAIVEAVEAAYDKFLLIDASSNGDEAEVKRLLAKELPVDTFDHQGVTALTCACARKHPIIVRLLLDHKVDPNLATKKMETPLDISIGKGDVEAVEMLLLAGAVVGPVALHRACGGNYADVVKVLLKYGAAPNVTARNTNAFPEPADFMISMALKVLPDDYPLHTAIRNNDPESVTALAAAKASTLVTNADKKTPLQLAQDMGNTVILKCINDRREEEMEHLGRSATQLNSEIGAMKTLRFKPKAGPL
ncbi:MAG: ankyrin repeat domain-containing protein [Alphaproteobacteria bacterium]